MANGNAVNIASNDVPVAIPLSTSSHEKSPKFDGTKFKRWQQKMLFYLTTLNLTKYLNEECPVVSTDNAGDRNILLAVDAWNHSDFLCRNYILNGLHDTLYNVYSGIKTAKALWESLEKKYKTEDVGTKKFVVARFLEYVMKDNKTVMSQVQS